MYVAVIALSAALLGVGSVAFEPDEERGFTATAAFWSALLSFIAGSVLYVYRFRGNTRYESFGKYFRKSWPIFAPFNCVLYLSTRKNARGPVLNAEVIPDLALLRDHWQIIRDEALALQASGGLEASVAVGAPGYYDVGFRTFYKYGWSKFYLCWYGYTHPSGLRACPRTQELLARVPSINGAMFSFLPPGAALTQHSDPLACSLRYHLGLATPQDPECFLEVDGVRRSWSDGQDFLFDETYPHFARNGTDRPRLILMCDVERPMHLGGRLFNRIYRGLAVLTVVPNTAEDERGFASSVFANIAPLLQRSRSLKTTNRGAYRVLKTAVNGTLVCILFGIVFAFVQLVDVLI
jgi:beta-hydroxylase